MAYTEETVLGILKARLNRLPTDTSLDTYLKQRVAAADEKLASDGIHLIAARVADQVLLADYTAWQHNSRDQQTGMPRWLQLAVRERWLADKRLNEEAAQSDS